IIEHSHPVPASAYDRPDDGKPIACDRPGLDLRTHENLTPERKHHRPRLVESQSIYLPGRTAQPTVDLQKIVSGFIRRAPKLEVIDTDDPGNLYETLASSQKLIGDEGRGQCQGDAIDHVPDPKSRMHAT